MADEAEVDVVEQLSGSPEGTVVNDERIVADRDEDGNVIGWHKEIV